MSACHAGDASPNAALAAGILAQGATIYMPTRVSVRPQLMQQFLIFWVSTELIQPPHSNKQNGRKGSGRLGAVADVW